MTTQNQPGPPGAEAGPAASGAPWPVCPHTDGLCVTYSLAERLGSAVMEALVEFAGQAEVGARLTVQRSQSGFTAQSTSAIYRGVPEQLSPEALAELQSRFDAD